MIPTISLSKSVLVNVKKRSIRMASSSSKICGADLWTAPDNTLKSASGRADSIVLKTLPHFLYSTRGRGKTLRATH